MAVLRNGSKCSHTTCMLRFFTVSRLALNTNLIFEIGSRKNIFVQIVLNMSISIFILQGKRILFRCSIARACFSWKPTDCLKGFSTR